MVTIESGKVGFLARSPLICVVLRYAAFDEIHIGSKP
jgi:hypothetical protein